MDDRWTDPRFLNASWMVTGWQLLSSHLNELSAHNLLYQLLLAAGEEGDVGGREGGDVGGGEGGRQAVQGGGGRRVDGRA